tara:strand:- start:1185 stop:1391 length:207 start_codon:yes stop_codon:yes gene_type:complete
MDYEDKLLMVIARYRNCIITKSELKKEINTITINLLDEFVRNNSNKFNSMEIVNILDSINSIKKVIKG